MEEMLKKIEAILNREIRPYLKSHGGNISVNSIIDGCVKVKLYGACSGCAMADTETLKRIEDVLVNNIDGVTSVHLDREINPELLDMARSILGLNSNKSGR